MPEIDKNIKLTESQCNNLLSLYKENEYFNENKKRLTSFILPVGHDIWDGDSIKGWDVLDLGCGSLESSKIDGYDKGEFEAWFPRVCSLYGARSVTGIDIYKQDPKDIDIYNHIVANLVNLLKENNLEKLLLPKKYDLINMFGVTVLGGPGKTFASTSVLRSPRYFYLPEDYIEQANGLMENLRDQSMNLLKPGGILAYETSIYKYDDKNNCLINLLHR